MKAGKRQSKWSLSILLLILMLSLAYNSYGDTFKPKPNTMSWRYVPAATGPTTITMTATTALDANDMPVQYNFVCTTDGAKSSGWIASPTYEAAGLTPSTTYSFKVYACDSVGNADACSFTLPATTDANSTPPVLRLDLNNSANNDDANTQTGFLPFTIENSGSEINGVVIDLGGNITSARRSDPTGAWTKYDTGGSIPGDPCYYGPRAGERIYRDFIYGINPSGVTITLWGLGVNQDCNITIWAYDSQTAENRTANWYANGTHILDTNFIGGSTGWPRFDNFSSTSYQDLYKYAFKGRATADAIGRIVLTSTIGPNSPANQPFAFVDAIKVEPNMAGYTYEPTKYAYHPEPVDDANGVSADVILEWKKSLNAETHDVYFGTNFNNVNNANRNIPLGVLVSQDQSDTTYAPPESLELNTTYYWRIDEVNAAPDYTIFKGEVWSFKTYAPILIATNPVPLDGVIGVLVDTTLSWTAGEYADTHDVYFGTNLNSVSNASRNNPLGVLVSQGQSAAIYDPPGTLASETNYYWRIDEVNAAPYYTIFKGGVWSFKTYMAPHSRTILPPYELGMWQGFRLAVVSYTFDDDTPNQLIKVVPMFDEPNFGFKLTLFTVTNWGPNWTGLQNAASEGHEIASHTVTHPDLTTLSLTDLTAQLVDSQSTINSYIPGQQCITLAYPNCATSSSVDTNTARYYIAARICSGQIEGNTPANFYEISSFVCGNTGSLNSPAALDSKFVSAASSQGWCVLLMHAVDDDSGYSPIASATIRGSLEYLAANRSTFWVQTFGNVVRYIKERNDVSLAELSNDGNNITLQLTDTLNDAVYNYPLTLRRPLPDGWPAATVTQNGRQIDVRTVMVNSTKYIMFDVVPDGGNIVLSNHGIIDMYDLSLFCSHWLEDDCSETEGIDLNGDCLVNFYEYAILAENWLLQVP